MPRQQSNPNARVSADVLALGASNVGLVENSDAGRASFKAWLSADASAAKKALIDRVVARRQAAASGAEQARAVSAGAAAAERLAASTAAPTAYPAGWRKGARAIGAAVVTAARPAGSARTPAGRVRITEATD